MLKIKKKDKVFILTGKYKKQIGLVSEIIIKKNNKKYVLIKGINLIKKHVRANPNKDKSGGILTKEAPINISNIMLINTKTNKKDKIKFEKIDKKKLRIFKKTNEVLT